MNRHTHIHIHSHTCTNTHTQTHTHTYTHSLSLSVLSLVHTLTLSLSLSLSHTHTQVQAKELDNRPCQCTLRCFDKVPLEQRKKIFDNFWALGVFDVQTAYLLGCVKVLNVRKSYTFTPLSSRRNFSRVFYVKNSRGVSIRVCKTAFLRIHSISNGRLDRALRVTEGGSPLQDQRGRHPPANKTDANVFKHVNDHIESFPHYTSHYSRKDNPNKLYLSPDLSLSKMYSLYKTHCEEQGYDIARVGV